MSHELDQTVIMDAVSNLGNLATDPTMILEAGKTLAQSLLVQGTIELNTHLLVGEKPTIKGYIGALLTGGNMIIGSIPGAGKTELLRHGHRVINGIEDKNVVTVPARADLTAAELTGKSQALKTTKHMNGNAPITERTVGEVEPILAVTNQIIAHDEGNRGNERTNSAMLDISGSRRIQTPVGTQDMTALELFLIAVNPTESLRTTMPLSPARAARQAWGSILADESEWDSILKGIIDEDFEPTPDEIKPVLNLKQLHVARAAISLVTIESTDLKPYLKTVTKQSLYALRNHDLSIREAPGRVANQIQSSARALALMSGRTSVQKKDIDLAMGYKLTAALIGNGIDNLDEVRPLVDDVVARSN